MLTCDATSPRCIIDDKDSSEDEFDELPYATTAAPPIAAVPKKFRLFFGTQSPIILCDLFDYSGNTRPKAHGLDFFMSNGLNNLEAELELYELLTRDMQQVL